MKKVCVAMSGGVDSSVAAAMLVDQGYEVFGAFMKNWSLDQQGVEYKPWENEANDAKAVCEKLNIPFYVFDFEKEYQERVVNSFVAEYSRGRTPNPDVLCNREIKFDLFLKKAEKMGADLIATGHYARIEQSEGKYHLLAGVDLNKDQTYFLYTLTAKDLEKIMFPIGHLLKSEVRNLAVKYNLPNAQKKDSQGVCFIGPVSMRKFLETYIKPKKGLVVLTDGSIVAEHDGVFFYTEGQRHGFNMRGGRAPLYVAEKNIMSNTLVVAEKSEPCLYSTTIIVDSLTWVNSEPEFPCKVMCRIRYRQQLYPAIIVNNNGAFTLQFGSPIFAVSPGQAAVFYEGNEVIGGGTIVKRLC